MSKAFINIVKLNLRIINVVAAEKDINRFSTRSRYNQYTVKGNTNSITGQISSVVFVACIRRYVRGLGVCKVAA
jgi:hypothetical protein